MRNFVIGCIVLFTMAGTAFSEEPKQPPKEVTVDLGQRRKAGAGPDPGGRVHDGLARFGQGRRSPTRSRSTGFGSPSRSTWASIW